MCCCAAVAILLFLLFFSFFFLFCINSFCRLNAIDSLTESLAVIHAKLVARIRLRRIYGTVPVELGEFWMVSLGNLFLFVSFRILYTFVFTFIHFGCDCHLLYSYVRIAKTLTTTLHVWMQRKIACTKTNSRTALFLSKEISLYFVLQWTISSRFLFRIDDCYR